MQNTFSQSGNDSKWFSKKSYFRIGMWHSRPPPLHGKYHLKFPFWLLEPLPYYNSWTPLPCTWTEKVDIGQPCWTISLFSNHSTSATSVHELVCQVVEHLGPKSGGGIRSKRTTNARHCCCCFLCPWPWAEHVWGHRAANMFNQRQQCRCARKI